MHNPEDLLAHTTSIVIAAIQGGSNEHPSALIESVYRALAATAGDAVVPVAASAPTPAVPVRNSIKPDHLVSLIDGRPYKVLRRHLSNHGYTPESYRAAFGLPVDYPMVAPAYAAQRRQLAIDSGLGRKAA